ncbi:hypothetical protein ACOZ35_08890 [Halorubrum xinjiangense]|uniref:hypothetical protein n=1 Tax=Halorubrum xinjiangense TaxID=261291 RepID=UPI003C705169
MVIPTDIGALPLAGLALLGVTFATASLQSRGRLPFAVPEGAYTSVSMGAVFLVAQFAVDSTWKTVAVLFVGSFAWATGYETGRSERER